MILIPDDSQEQKVCELISSTIGIIINPNALKLVTVAPMGTIAK